MNLGTFVLPVRLHLTTLTATLSIEPIASASGVSGQEFLALTFSARANIVVHAQGVRTAHPFQSQLDNISG
jgi:hypothetical protein